MLVLDTMKGQMSESLIKLIAISALALIIFYIIFVVLKRLFV